MNVDSKGKWQDLILSNLLFLHSLFAVWVILAKHVWVGFGCIEVNSSSGEHTGKNALTGPIKYHQTIFSFNCKIKTYILSTLINAWVRGKY